MYGTALRMTVVLAMLTASAFTLSACEEAPSEADRTGTAPEAGMSEGAPEIGTDGGTPETAPVAPATE